MSLKPQNLGGWQIINELGWECQKADKPVGTVILKSKVIIPNYGLIFNIIYVLF